jgi:uncharacterized protein YcbX
VLVAEVRGFEPRLPPCEQSAAHRHADQRFRRSIPTVGVKVRWRDEGPVKRIRASPRLTVALTHSGSDIRLLDSESVDRLHQALPSDVYVGGR